MSNDQQIAYKNYKESKMKNGMNRVTMMNTATQGFNALSTKLFSYAGSKMKFKQQFKEVHTEFGKMVKKVKVDTYIEAFAGTLASLFHNLEHVDAKRYIVNDANKRIINLYEQIQNNPHELFRKFALLESEFQRIVPEPLRNQRYVNEQYRTTLFKANQDFYLEARDLLNTSPFDVNNAALFLFVMQHNFNGLFHENKKGDFNTSFNWSSQIIKTETIHQSILTLHAFFTSHDVIFESMDVFELVEKYDQKETFIYLDPPYSNSNIQYKQGTKSFNEVQTHLELLKLCDKYDYVMYSNNHESVFEEIFKTHVNFSRGNFGNKKTEKSTKEILAIKTNIQIFVYTPISALLGLDLPTVSYAENIIVEKAPIKSSSIAELLSCNAA